MDENRRRIYMSLQPGYGRSVKPGYCGEWDKWNGQACDLTRDTVATLIR